MSELSRFTSGRRRSDATLALARLAARQWGVVTWWQLKGHGVGDATIGRWVEAGRLHRLFPGVYALGHRTLCDEGWLAAALLYAGKGAALSHDTGAWWWEIVKQRPSRIDVSAPGYRSSLSAREVAGRISSPAVVVHHPRHIPRVFQRGLPVTTPARTLLDISPTCPRRQLRRALAETFYLRWATPDEVRTVLKKGHPGSAALREALEAHVPQLARTKSELETRFLELCEEHGIPLPEVNVRVCGLEVDAYWPDHGLVVELDGGPSHAGPDRVTTDRERELTLREAGLRVRRFSWIQVTQQSRRVAIDLLTTLASPNPRQESTGLG